MGPVDDLERLLENASWVRALGVELVGAGEAEDLVQDAWLAALEQPGAARNPAAWLSGVVRRLAGRRRRSGERRARRERTAARPEAQPAADELVAEAELSRALILAVSELEEPYRSTVLLRFYRGWTPQEMARSAGVPDATVRTRLARALAKLRERLDREHGGRAAWAVCFAGSSTSATVTTISGGALMGAKSISAAAALAALAGWAIWQGRGVDGRDSSRREQGVVATPAAAPAGALELPPEGAVAVSESATRERLAPPAPSHPVGEVLLYGSVLDERAEPVELDWVALEQDGIGAASASEPSAGSYSVAGLAPGRYTLVAQARGFVTRRDELELRGDREHERHDLVLETALAIPVKLVDESGALLDEERRGPARFDVVATRTPPSGTLRGLRADPGPLYECAEFARGPFVPELPDGYSGLLRLRVAPPVYVSVVLLDATLATRLVEGPMTELVFTLERAGIERQLGGIRARFVDALTGMPIRGGRAALDPPQVYSPGELSEDGSMSFAERAPGPYQLRFTHDGYEQAARSVRVPAGRLEDLGDVPIWPAATLRVTVLAAEGQLTAATIWVVPREVLRDPADLELGTFWSVRGKLELRVARAPVQLLVDVKDHARLSRTIDASGGLVDGLVLQVEKGVRVVLRASREEVGRQLTLAAEDGLPLETFTLREARSIQTRLVPGRYQVWLGDAERVDRVEELVVGREPLDVVVGGGR